MKKYSYVFLSFSMLVLGSLVSAAEKNTELARQPSSRAKTVQLILQQRQAQEKEEQQKKLAAEQSQQLATETAPGRPVSLQSGQASVTHPTTTPESLQALGTFESAQSKDSKLSSLGSIWEKFPTNERYGDERE